MAGSLEMMIRDVKENEGDLTSPFTLLDNMGDAYEACEEAVAEIERLTPYYQAIDDLAVITWTLDKSLTAKEQLAKIIEWEIQVATDPLVNGGKVLVDKTEIERLQLEADCAGKNAAKYHDIIREQRREIERLRELVYAEQDLAKGIKERNAYLEQKCKRLLDKLKGGER